MTFKIIFILNNYIHWIFSKILKKQLTSTSNTFRLKKLHKKQKKINNLVITKIYHTYFAIKIIKHLSNIINQDLNNNNNEKMITNFQLYTNLGHDKNIE